MTAALVSLKNIRISIRKGKAYPKFSDAEMELELSKARDCFEKNLGMKFHEFDNQEVKRCFSDAKTAEAAISMLGRFYSFRTRTLNDLLGEEEVKRLSKMGINSCMDLRLRFFEFLALDHSGFMSSESRLPLLQEFADRIEMAESQLDDALWLDEDDNKILSRRVDTPPKNLGAVFSLEILSTILCNSYLLRLGPVEDGSSVKFIFRNLKFYGLLFQVVRGDDGFIFEVEGPLDISGKASKFGYRLAILLYRLRQLSLRRQFDCSVSVEFRKSKRKVILETEISKMPDISWPNVGELKFQLFDSKVEAKIYSTFRAIDLDGWHVEREPKPLISGETVFIPDFSLRRGGAEVFVEVVGFWMPEYKNRKRAKLQEMERSGLENLLLIVDKKIEEDFKSLTHFPIFTYSRSGSSYKIPYSRILGYLESKFPGGKCKSEKKKEILTEPGFVEHTGGKYKIYW